jgi:hypothetical protein
LLDAINLYLWSQRTAALPQQIQGVKDAEMLQYVQEYQALHVHVNMNAARQVIATQSALSTKVSPLPQAVLDKLSNTTTPMPRFFEELNASWGTETRIQGIGARQYRHHHHLLHVACCIGLMEHMALVDCRLVSLLYITSTGQDQHQHERGGFCMWACIPQSVCC